MSTALVSSACYNLGDVFYKHQNSPVISTHKSVPLERRYLGSTSPRRNSTSSVSLISPPKSSMHQKPPVNGLAISTNSTSVLPREHRKLDRSLSEPVERNQQQPRPNQANSSRYKTELCRPFEENGTCKYGDKCQFAHGAHELRTLTRHPKYKTELCRTFHTTGFCPYGPRCHFIHNSEETKKNLLTNLQAAPQQGPTPPQGPSSPPPPPIALSRPKALSVGSFSLGSAGELSPPSSQSGSPTSLHSFGFADDPFGFSPTTPSSNGINNAFAFSQDFSPLKQQRQQSVHLPNYGGSQPALGSTTPPYIGNEIPDTFPFTGIDTAATALVHGPPSPVDSFTSEMDVTPATCNSPPTIGDLSDLNRRLPIFARIATNGDSD